MTLTNDQKTAINAALQRLAAKRPAYVRYRNYYKGIHRLAFATAKFREAFGLLFNEFADNLCPAVIQATNDRLEVTGFGVEISGDPYAIGTPDDDASGDDDSSSSDESEETTLAAIAWAIWKRNRMGRAAKKLTRHALYMGDAYLIVWPDATGFPRLYPNSALNVCTFCDPENMDVVESAAKLWPEPSADGEGMVYRLNLYYADRIEKYVTQTPVKSMQIASAPVKPDDFTAYLGDDDPQTETAGGVTVNPFGCVPVFHLANDADIGGDGVSELLNAVPIQDGLNKAVCDQIIAMEFTSYAQRWATGVEIERGEDGKPINNPFDFGINRVVAVAANEAKFGEFLQADLEKIVGVVESFRVEMARITGTPLHYMALQTGTPPSGEALNKLETRLLKKVFSRHEEFGPPLEDAMAFALRIAKKAPKDGLQLSTKWADPMNLSPTEIAQQVLLRQQVGIDKVTALTEIGFTRAEAQKMADEAQQQQQAGLGNIMDSFNRGMDTGEGKPIDGDPNAVTKAPAGAAAPSVKPEKPPTANGAPARK